MKTRGQTRKHCFRNKNVSEFVWKHFCFLGSKFCYGNNVPKVGKQGNIDKKHNVSVTMFPSLPRAYCIAKFYINPQMRKLANVSGSARDVCNTRINSNKSISSMHSYINMYKQVWHTNLN